MKYHCPRCREDVTAQVIRKAGATSTVFRRSPTAQAAEVVAFCNEGHAALYTLPGHEPPGAQGGTASQVPQDPVAADVSTCPKVVERPRAYGGGRVRLLAALTVGVLLGVLLVPRLSSSHWQPGYHNRVHAVHWAFCGKQTKRTCSLGWQAVRVAKCESGWSMTPRAHNGIYLGAFQMGTYARARYGHSFNIWGQAAAAFRYFRDAGWSPWSCARIVGVR